MHDCFQKNFLCCTWCTCYCCLNEPVVSRAQWFTRSEPLVTFCPQSNCTAHYDLAWNTACWAIVVGVHWAVVFTVQSCTFWYSNVVYTAAASDLLTGCYCNALQILICTDQMLIELITSWCWVLWKTNTNSTHKPPYTPQLLTNLVSLVTHDFISTVNATYLFQLS